MPFPLFQFLSQDAARANPTAAAANLAHQAIADQQNKLDKLRLAEQKSEFGQTFGLNVRKQDQSEANDVWEKNKDKFNAVKTMVDALSKGDYATAHAIGSQLGILGMPAPEFSATPGGQTSANGGEPADNTPIQQPMSAASPGRMTINEDEFRAQNKGQAQRMGAGFKALPLPGGFPADAVTAPAENATEQKYAIDNAMDLVNNSMRHPRGGAGGGGGPGFKAIKDIQNNYRAWVSEANKDQRVANINQYKTDAEKALGMLEAGGGMSEGQRLMAAQTIKTFFGAAASEGERAFILGGAGMAGRMEMWVNSWVKSGEMPQELIRQLQLIQQRSQKLAQDKVNEIASQIEADYMNSPEADALTPDQKQRMGRLGHSALGSKAPGLSAPTAPKKLPKVFQ